MLTPPIFEVGSRSYVAAHSGSLGKQDPFWSRLHPGDRVAGWRSGKKFESFGNEVDAADLSSPTADFVFF